MQNRPTARPDREGGFTLVEVVVSMVLLAVVTMLMLPALVTGLTAFELNRDTARATRLASQEVEAVRAVDCTEVAADAQQPATAQVPWSTVDTTLWSVRHTFSGSCAPQSVYEYTVTVTLRTSSAATATVSTAVLVGAP